MASPKTDHLPLIPAGIIWDGVTEYQDVRPPGVSDRLSSSHVRGRNPTLQRTSCSVANPDRSGCYRAKADGWEQDRNYFPRPGGFLNVGFLAYDGSLSFDPVNQYFELNAFREHAARFAHQLDASMGHHTLASADERDRLATYNTLADLIGNAWRKFQEWDDIDSQEIISGGNFDGTLLWKRDIDEYRSVHDYLCGECDIATFARRFILNANLDLFRRIYRQGLVYATNRDTTPWEPRFIDVATSPQSSFYEQLRVDYHLALTHYDHVIGVQDVQG